MVDSYVKSWEKSKSDIKTPKKITVKGRKFNFFFVLMKEFKYA
jgi:hypothetical protein